METKIKSTFIIAVLLFGVGDLATTYHLMSMGFVEYNIILANLSFISIVVIKTLFLMFCYGVLTVLNDYKFESGIVLGSVIAVGVVTTLSNIGFYSGVV